ncbi:hypothetical protein KCG48_05070 [Proteiniclasticum sp. BAD-10]|uniref:Uncharacterized protein n=1 Tax=Proteiniclasticum sediminis TaxID=2804028 RepID=A0A941HR05_9CLOT|nr:hypothetical protein [Proteiniclasticum sediminis]MBR0575712.1 hypothetical protein [Proteiniclasticum sediminis]
MTYYMIQYYNTIRHKEPTRLFRSYKEAEQHLRDKGFQTTSNPWLGTVYSYLHKESEMAEDARIIMVIAPEEETKEETTTIKANSDTGETSLRMGNFEMVMTDKNIIFRKIEEEE